MANSPLSPRGWTSSHRVSSRAAIAPNERQEAIEVAIEHGEFGEQHQQTEVAGALQKHLCALELSREINGPSIERRAFGPGKERGRQQSFCPGHEIHELGITFEIEIRPARSVVGNRGRECCNLEVRHARCPPVALVRQTDPLARPAPKRLQI